MTDTEIRRREAICKAAGVSEIDDLSDGFHTFRQLYYQRMMLFATIVKQNKDRAWKSLRHEDGTLCFHGGWFIVGIDTPEGSYTYHYEDIYFSLFDCEELERGKHWDGHTEKDVTRLLSLPTIEELKKGEWIMMEDGTLSITTDMDVTNVGRILLNQKEAINGTLYYPDGTTRKGIWKTTRLDYEAMGERPLLWYCSECDVCSTQPTKYCPHCGKRMING